MKKQFYEANARVVQLDVNGEDVAANSWGLANKYKLEVLDLRHRMWVASPLVIAGIKHYHPLVSSVCDTIMKSVKLLPQDQMDIVYEGWILLLPLRISLTHSLTHSLVCIRRNSHGEGRCSQ